MLCDLATKSVLICSKAWSISEAISDFKAGVAWTAYSLQIFIQTD